MSEGIPGEIRLLRPETITGIAYKDFRKLIFTMYNMPLARTVTEVRTMHRDA